MDDVARALDFIDELHSIVSNKSCLRKYVILSKQEQIDQFLQSQSLPENYKTMLRRYRDVISELYNTPKRG